MYAGYVLIMAKNVKLYDFVNNCIMEHLLDATMVYSGTGLATAATLAMVVPWW